MGHGNDFPEEAEPDGPGACIEWRGRIGREG